MKKIRLFILITLLGHVAVKAQDLNDVKQKIRNYAATAVQEKLFVHTDKSFYLTGEILWLKVYNTDAVENKPLDVSKVAYVEVLDQQHNAVIQTKIELKDGSGSGSVYLPVSLSNGNYKLRAYTSWMKNFSADYYFEKNITIINPLRPANETAKTDQGTEYDARFFPEGGYLVRGLPGKVAFSVVNAEGRGVNFKGAVLNQHNDTVARFAPLKFGIGSFLFTPAAGDSYYAVLRVGNKTIRRALPAIAESGYTMQLTDGHQGMLSISVTGTNRTEQVYLLAHTRGEVKVAKAQILSEGKTSFEVNTADLGEGISAITVFNSAKQPVCERLYFKRPTSQLNLLLSADREQYDLRKKVTLNITATDKTKKPVKTDLSLSVFRIDSLQKPENADILSYLWLCSELRGNIESPAYYFSAAPAETDEALDNLMLSQGWRRFEWKQVLSGSKPAFAYAPELTGHLITAKIINNTDKQPAGGIIAYLGIPGKRAQMYPAKADSTGHLLFNTKDFYGPAEVVLETDFETDSTYHIDVLSPFSEQYASSTLPAFQLNPALQTELKRHSLEMQVQNAYQGDLMRRYLDPDTDSTAFYYKAPHVYKLDDYTRFTTMEEDLREYVKEIFVAKRKRRFDLDVLGENGFLREGNPLVMIDGVPFFNMDKVVAVDPMKIKKLDVYNQTYFYGPTINNGIMSYATYRGDLSGIEVDPRAVIMDYEGMQLQRRFYSPAYDNETRLKSRMPDYRNVLYWSATAGTEAGGQNQLSFYTGDEPGRYIGVIQGLAADGAAGAATVSFEVKK